MTEPELKRAKTTAVELPPNTEIVGTLDFSFKIGFKSLECEFGDQPLWHWWGVFLIHVDLDNQADLLKCLAQYSARIVENIDTQWFLVQFDTTEMCKFALEPNTPFKHIFELSTIINDDVTPCVASKAEVQKLEKGRFVHIGLSAKRKVIVAQINILKKISPSVFLVASMLPSLKVCDFLLESSADETD